MDIIEIANKAYKISVNYNYLEIDFFYLFFILHRKKVDILALTEKQEKFCRNIVSGMTTKDAYISAYNTKCNDNTAWVEATRLLNKEDIQAKIKALRKPLEEAAQAKAQNARQKQIDFIQSRIEHCLAVGDEQSIIRYTDMLSKIHGLYKEVEQEKTQDQTVNNLDTNILRKLAN